MQSVLLFELIFYYIAFMTSHDMCLLNNYKSEIYLYSTARNVGFLKRFYGL